MTIKMIVPAMLGAMIMAAPVLAAESNATSPVNPVPTHKAAAVHHKNMTKKRHKANPVTACASLERQLNSAIKRHAKSAHIETAKKMREEGRSACANANKYRKDGIAKLQRGLKDLGVKPRA